MTRSIAGAGSGATDSAGVEAVNGGEAFVSVIEVAGCADADATTTGSAASARRPDRFGNRAEGLDRGIDPTATGAAGSFFRDDRIAKKTASAQRAIAITTPPMINAERHCCAADATGSEISGAALFSCGVDGVCQFLIASTSAPRCFSSGLSVASSQCEELT